ncbi:PDK [Symbiodinium sp. CCMP2592]|nr:PDK [Symbiodinium sp. CCMP2592]
MGCSGSRDGVLEMSAAFGAGSPVASPPAKVLRAARPPNRDSHDQHVEELNAYLASVAKHPDAFQEHVQRRRGKF